MKKNFNPYADALQVGYLLGILRRVDNVNQIPGVNLPHSAEEPNPAVQTDDSKEKEILGK